MTDAPERIWIDAFGGNWSPRAGGTQGHEYVRADLYTALQTRMAEVEEGRQSLFDLWSREKAARFDAETRSEAAEAALATARADALREAAHKLGEVAKKHSAGRAEIIKAVGRAILALIDNPEPTK